VKLIAPALLLVAAYYRSGPLFFAVGVMLVIAVGAHVWLNAVVAKLWAGRSLDERLFFGEDGQVHLTFTNAGPLPIPWLEIHESKPTALALPNVLSQVLHLAPFQRVTVTYTLRGRRRGFHAVGPLTCVVGDVFGLARRELLAVGVQHVLVYPRILPTEQFALPAVAMFGVVRSRRQLLGDPSRLAGVRQYMPGDPLHDIHWPATAATGALQVKQYQPATTLQTVIFLDLYRADYNAVDMFTAAEFAISIAATIGARLIEQRQEVGLVTNGRILPIALETAGATPAQPERHSFTTADEVSRDADAEVAAEGTRTAASLAPARGRTHLMRILEVLARVEPAEQGERLIRMLSRRASALPWGSTVVVVVGSTSEELFLALHRLRQAGLLVVVLLVEPLTDVAGVEARARAIGATLHVVWRELDIQALGA
jgi:uncharacterized protein (DUF58 family)